DDLPEVHDRHPVAQVLDDAEVVRDEEHGEAEAPAQILQQVQDLRLDRDVEGRDGLVGHHEAGADGEGPRDADALALAAAELVRIAARGLGRQAHQLEQLSHPLPALRACTEAMDREPFADDALDAHARIERAVGVLEDDLHLAAERAQLARPECQERAPVERHLPRGGLDEAQHETPERRLPRARLADQAEGLARLDGQRHAVHGQHPGARPAEEPAPDREVLADLAYLDERRHRRMHAARWPGACSSSGGATPAQSAIACGQRSRKVHPLGSRRRSGTVVGSSAISARGSHEIAIAIITRCRMPPESRWGWSRARRAGSGMPTSASSSTARSQASRRETGRWSRTASAIWLPTVSTGLSDVIGSWKIMARPAPRTARMSRSGSVRRSRPSKETLPPTMRPGGGTRRMSERALTLFPQPDSPTSPRTRPASSANDTPSTA